MQQLQHYIGNMLPARAVQRCCISRRGYDPSHYSIRWLRMETYPWRERVRSASKKTANARLAELVQRLPATAVGRRHDLWALVLDAPTLASSRALKNAGFRPERIIVPNDSDSPFGIAAAKHAVVLQGVNLHNYLLGSKLATPYVQKAGNPHGRRLPTAGPFSCVFCDFTTCLDGSWRPSHELDMGGEAVEEGCYGDASCPKEDIKTLVRGGHLDPSGAVLAVTLAHMRETGGRARRVGHTADQWERLRMLVASLAVEQGLCAVPVPQRVDQAAVATEFWLLGQPGNTGFVAALDAEGACWA